MNALQVRRDRTAPYHVEHVLRCDDYVDVEIGERTTFGHWECALVAFRQVFGKHNITSLVERRSRYLFISRNPSRHSANIMAGLVRDLGPLPPACRCC